MVVNLRATCAGLALGALMGLSAVAQGREPAAPPSDDRAAAARHYEDGIKAIKEKQWEQARLAFLEAWKLKQHPQIAANLGRAELMAGRYRDAAEHLAYFLREAKGASEDELRRGREMLEQARAKIGALTLRVEPDGAQVTVDGAALGRAPLPDGILVEPGLRVIEVHHEGYVPARHEIQLGAGTSATLAVRLERELDPSVPAAAQPGPPSEPGGRSTVLLGIGIGATAAATGVGVALILLGIDKQQAQEEIRLKGYPAASKHEWHELERARASLFNAATWSLIGAGTFGAASITYAITRPDRATASRTGSLRVSPWGTGMGVSGEW